MSLPSAHRRNSDLQRTTDTRPAAQAVDVALARYQQGGSEAVLFSGQAAQDTEEGLQQFLQDIISFL